MSAQIPEKILSLARAVRAEGGRALLVGGCVRDRLMGREAKDWDVEVYGVEPGRLRGLLDRLGRVNVVGEAFTVYKLGHDLDVSLPRRERKAGRGHRGFVIEGDPWMSFEEATRRRDFTVNAILEDPLTGEVIDPFDGRADLGAGRLRAVSRDTFAEDSLRVLRAAQFAARFGFDVEPGTVELCRTIDLTDLPPERVWGEMEKLLLGAARPSAGLEWLERLGATAQLFPELRDLIGCPQESQWHPEGWSLSEATFQPPRPAEARAAAGEGRLTLGQFCARTAAGPGPIPSRQGAAGAPPPQTPPAELVAAEDAGAHESGPPAPHPPAAAQPESLVWTFGSAAPSARPPARVSFGLPLKRACTLVRAPSDDSELVAGVVHPVAAFVADVLGLPAPTAEPQFRGKAEEGSDGPDASRQAGAHVASAVVDARAAAVDGEVLFYFDLPAGGEGEAARGGESAAGGRSFRVRVGDVWTHTLQVADRARESIEDLDYPRRVTVMLAALCHDLGKPATTEFAEGRWRSRGHEEAGAEPTLNVLDRLKIFTLEGYDVRSQVVALVRDHLKPGEFYRTRDEITDGAFRRLARRCELELLYRVARADSLGREAPWLPPARRFTAEAQEWFIARARELRVEQRPPAPILQGRHLLELGLSPSPLVGQIVRAVYEMQLDGRVATLDEAREAARLLVAETGPGED